MARYISGRITGAGLGVFIGIIVLTVALVGGLLFVKYQGEQARRAEAIKIAEEKLKAESNNDVALNGDGGAGNEKNQTQAPAETGQGGAQTGQSSSQAQRQSVGGGAVPSEMPQTGVHEWGVIVALGAVVYGVAAYLRSRKILFKLY